MGKRGQSWTGAQVSVEFLFVVGFAFLMTIPLIIIFYQQSENLDREITASQVDKVASEIRDAADEVYYLGEPSKKTITVYVPESVRFITLDNDKIIFNVSSASGEYQVVKWCAANLIGSIKQHKGIHVVRVQAMTNYVNITG